MFFLFRSPSIANSWPLIFFQIHREVKRTQERNSEAKLHRVLNSWIKGKKRQKNNEERYNPPKKLKLKEKT